VGPGRKLPGLIWIEAGVVLQARARGFWLWAWNLSSTIVVFVTVLGCSRNAATPAPSTRPDIVLVTIDTLRADRVGRGLTPTLDALGKRGVRFANARTAVPLTLPAHVTIMTGALPPQHSVRENGVLFKGTPAPLARVLRDAGYATAAFVGAYVLDRRFGLSDGFDVYDDRVPRDPSAAARLEAERRGSDVVDAALEWLASAKRPFFIWVHLYDPHAPYNPPPEFLAKAAGNAYDGEVAYADDQVGRLFDGLKSRGAFDTSFIVVAGDHGEGLGEHGEDTHGMLAYDSTLRVPLIAASPLLTPSVVADPVSLSEVAPSILRQIGMGDRVPAGASGWHLFSRKPSDRDVYGETMYPRTAGWHPIATLAGERWKLVLSSESELYDAADDPAETKNLAAERPAIVQGMTKRLDDLRRTDDQPPAAVPAEAAERLRALGYVGGSSASPVDPNAPNPAKVIGAWSRFETALALVTAGRAREALPALDELATRYPSALVFQSIYARALAESGKPAEALTLYRSAVARWSNDAALFHELAVAARAAGQSGEAMRAEQAALALDPSNPAALNGLGLLHADAGRAAEAAAAFERAAKADPSNASYWANLGNARRDQQDLAGAESAYRRALEADSSFPDAANGLGVLLVQQGKAVDAVPWFERALQRSPDFYEARLNLGIAYHQSGNREKAREVYRDLLANAPARFERERRAAAELLKGLR
jgi:choline-sulfatase